LVLSPWAKGSRGSATKPTTTIRVAGVQMEFPGTAEVLQNLRRLPKACPDAQLVVLSEYTFDGPIPDSIRAWCRKERRWLVAGGKEPSADGRFQNTAYVVDTNGVVVFQQVKAVPIQFFKDGELASRQEVWDSPWGKLGLCVCYDQNYARVADRLIRQGARALIVPTMDVESWGLHEHHLNARMTSIRAAEYRVPIFRVASSGFSQLIDDRGRVQANTTVPGPGEMISGELRLAPPASARLPLDRVAAPVAVGATVAIVLGLLWLLWSSRRAKGGPRTRTRSHERPWPPLSPPPQHSLTPFAKS
jgi:apolipoprotein N-acyltransferase